MEHTKYEMNEYFSEDDHKRLSRILMQSRAESGLSQEKVALEMGIAKKTVQNWERGVSAPTLPQAIEWFRVLKIPPMPYFLQFIFPDFEGVKSTNEDEQLRKKVITMIESLPSEGIHQLMYLFYGNHGSSPRGILNLMTAHLQSPLRDRLSHAYTIQYDYKIADELNCLTNPNHAQPNLDVLEDAIELGHHSVINKKNHYTLINGDSCK